MQHRIADELRRGDVALARWLWRRGQGALEPSRLVFVDETGTATNMAPRYGWAHSSERVTMGAPHGSWTSATLVAGLTERGIIAPLVLDGSMTGRAFEAWVEQSLMPTPPPRAIVVMDNLSSHKECTRTSPVSSAVATPRRRQTQRAPGSAVAPWQRRTRELRYAAGRRSPQRC